jgi:hypothetical protein
MESHDVITALPIEAWHGPIDAALRARAIEALEAGRVLTAPLAFALAPDEGFLLSPSVMGSERKNISLDPVTLLVGNTSLAGAQAEMLRGGAADPRSAAWLCHGAGAGAHQLSARRDCRAGLLATAR